MKKIIGFILISFFMISCKGQEASLSFNLEEGKDYRQTTKNKSTVIQNINGQEVQVITTMDATIIYRVQKAHDQHYDIEVIYESTSMGIQMPNGSIEFSSEKDDPSDLMSSLLRTIKGKSFDLKMSKSGKVMEIRNTETLWEGIPALLVDMPEAQAEQIKQQIIKSFGGEAMKGNMEMLTAIYPESPVNKGDKWNIKTKIETIMLANISTDYEFSEVVDNYAVIKGNSTIESEDSSVFKESNGIPMRFDLSGAMQSEFKVDKKSGWILEAKFNQSISGNGFIKAGSLGTQEEIQIPMSVTNEILITE